MLYLTKREVRMRYVLFVLFLLLSCSYARAEDSKKVVWKTSCEATFFKLFLTYGNGKKANKEMSQDVVDICRKLVVDLDQRKRWNQISSPTESGCFAAIKVMHDSNPGWEKKPQELFGMYCVQIN